jgi:hypothetical protein
MRFLIIVKATASSEAGVMPDQPWLSAMARYREELAAAGVLLDAAGLQPSAKGWRLQFGNGQRRIVDGPFSPSDELAAGYTLIQVRSREEAMEWTRRFPCPAVERDGGEIEVRPLFELDDCEPGSAIERPASACAAA